MAVAGIEKDDTQNLLVKKLHVGTGFIILLDLWQICPRSLEDFFQRLLSVRYLSGHHNIRNTLILRLAANKINEMIRYT